MRLAKVPFLNPGVVMPAATIATDAVFDYGEGLRSGEDPLRAAAGVAGSAGGYAAAYALAHRRMPRMAGLVPVVAGFGGSMLGGWMGDRADSVARGI